MPLEIPDSLREKLVALRAKQLSSPNPDEVVVEQGVVLLDGGMGPALYIGLDGTIVIWHYMEDESPRITDDLKDIAAALLVGAEKQGLPELLELLPQRPADGVVCELCSGSRWIQVGIKLDKRTPGRIVCVECGGVGWVHTE